MVDTPQANPHAIPIPLDYGRPAPPRDLRPLVLPGILWIILVAGAITVLLLLVSLLGIFVNMPRYK